MPSRRRWSPPCARSAAGHVKIVPDIQVGGEGGVLGGLGALLMRSLSSNGQANANANGDAGADAELPERTDAPT